MILLKGHSSVNLTEELVNAGHIRGDVSATSNVRQSTGDRYIAD